MIKNNDSVQRGNYLELFLNKLCTEIGPRPAGSTSYNRSVSILKSELDKYALTVELDKFYFDYWELVDKPIFKIGNRELEIWPYYATKNIIGSGINGNIKRIDNEEQIYSIYNPINKQTLANIEISPFGKAIPKFAWKQEYRNLPAITLGKQDKNLLDKAIEEKSSVYLNYNTVLNANKESSSVIAYLPGKSKEEIVLMAHADTHSNTPGANDNTATLITLLMMAKYFSKIDHNYSLTFVASGGEEVGHLGSIHYVETRKKRQDLNKIKACINFDSLTYGPNLMIHSKDKQLSLKIEEIHNNLKLKGKPELIYENDLLDGKAFIDEGIRCVYINSRGKDQSKLKLWHRPEDIPAEVDFELVENSFLIFTEFIKRISEENLL